MVEQKSKLDWGRVVCVDFLKLTTCILQSYDHLCFFFLNNTIIYVKSKFLSNNFEEVVVLLIMDFLGVVG